MDIGAEIKNQYRVVEHIGRGGMADVWSARDMRLNRMVAIKTIAHGLSSDADPVALFEREAQTIANLEHPHILPIYDFGEYQGQLYIVMRYVTGGSLEHLLERGPLPMNEVVRIGDAIARALDYAHTNKVIHLDLKPPNILLDSQNTPYLADFGLATVLDREGRARNPGAGTLLYMAPEQLTADIVDHRVDIYAFSIMLFHMFTGQLPFDTTTALALKQLQFQEEMPDIERFTPDLPAAITAVLRRGTAVTANHRPATLNELMEDLHDVLADTALSINMGGYDDGFDAYDGDIAHDQVVASDDMELLEAVDLYSRARHVWAGGRGRFLLGVTHFMLMNGYYMQAESHGLTLDEAGMQMLLRGALEYDHEIDFWWGQLDDSNRRWVCLHAIRSANAPTRIRALYRLETLPDAETPQIPKLVAQALQVETNQEAKLAALQVLGTRAKLMKSTPDYDIKTEFRGRLLTTMTRIGIQANLPNVWQEVIYTPEIDLLVAQVSLDQGMPAVAEFAARTIGRMRSLSAVRYIARQQRLKVKGALQALALVRDEAPSLPDVVSARGRLYAWLANTWRRITDHPMRVVWRYVFALIGGWLALGMHVLTVFRNQALFVQQKWANAVAMGLLFGAVVGFVSLMGHEFPTRLRGFWTWWARLAFGIIGGTLFGMATWWAWQWFFLGQQPGNDILYLGGFGLALGFVLSSMFDLKWWWAVPLTALLSYAPIWITFQGGVLFQPVTILGQQLGTEALLYYGCPAFDGSGDACLNQIYTVAIPFAILVAVGGYFPAILGSLAGFINRLRGLETPVEVEIPTPQVDFAGQRSTQPGRRLQMPTLVPGGKGNMATQLDPQGIPYDEDEDGVDYAETAMFEADSDRADNHADMDTDFDVNRNLYKDEEDD